MALTSRGGTLGGPLSYEGRFDPDFDLSSLSRRAGATLGREWLLHGHLHDRAGMPLYLARATRLEMESLAIDEWMSASPVYTKRMQQALGFEGDDIPTLFKNLQLDIGAPHQFMDFRFEVKDAAHGEFWLNHCGALMDVEPLGEDFVVGMCHHIEDPTFDATAGAVDPRARIRPLHRPPRVPADRHPHCHWTATIDSEADPLDGHPHLVAMRASKIANLPVQVAASGYSGPFDPDFQLEDLSAATQKVALEEFAVQSHLIARAYMSCLAARIGEIEAVRLGYRAITGLAGITAERLVSAAHIAGKDSTAMAKLLQIHPIFHPRSYIETRIEVVDEGSLRLSLLPCLALDEADSFHWLAGLDRHGTACLDAVVRAIDPRATFERVSPTGGENAAYLASMDTGPKPKSEPAEMALVRLSTGAGFQFRPRR